METNLTIISGIFLACLTFGWGIYKYFDTRTREQNLSEFENYHRLIKKLVQPEDMEKEIMFVDRQTAIIYELRHFKRYYPYSYRTLIGLYEKWKKVPNQYPRLLDETERTIAYLKEKLGRGRE